MGEGPALPLFLRPSGIPHAFRGALRNGTCRYETSFPNEALSKDSLARKALEREGLRTGRSGEGGKEGPTFFRKVFPPFPNLPSHFQNNLRHADETADAARPPASAAPVLGNRRLAVRRGNRHGTFSGSGFNGLRPVCMGALSAACWRLRASSQAGGSAKSPFPASPKSTQHGWKRACPHGGPSPWKA